MRYQVGWSCQRLRHFEGCDGAIAREEGGNGKGARGPNNIINSIFITYKHVTI